jgi:hypothetical protein
MQNPSAIRNRSRAAAASRELSWSFMLLVILCACIVAAGFFFAARQHFNAMEFGIKNSKLREQLRNLETEKRRLQLAREVALSPLSIRKAALGLGLRESTSADAVLASAKPVATEKIEAVKVREVKDSSTPATERATVVRTVMAEPAQAKQPVDTRSRVVETRKDKKEGAALAALLKLR